ncbi:MAG: hypothetical protein RL154_1153, partial [Pseudomonadota bacterium]
MKKLPIGIQTFREIRSDDDSYIYVDKTDIAHQLISQGKYYFLSRPRRFGKSLFLDTLKEIFYGNKELFRGLHIYDKYEFIKYPVINISFGGGDFKGIDKVRQRMTEILNNAKESLGVVCEDSYSLAGCLERLIHKAYQKHNQRVVVLIDEYDKPILDNIENPEIAREIRDELKGFYSVIKGADEYLKFVFLTGVSKFSKVSLFSGLNNLNDITLDKSYSTICGYTQEDIETVFSEHLKGQDFDKIKYWYNGYKWLGKSVYNPFDILLFIQKGFVYENYWFSTATPTFLLKLIEKHKYFLPSLENIVADSAILNSFDVDYIEPEALMWQTGYLTITHTETILDSIEYHLAIPNKEVRQSLLRSIALHMTRADNLTSQTNGMLKAILKNDLALFQTHLISLFASIPYNLFTNNKLYKYEGYYVSVFYAYMKSLGVELIAEDVTNKGRIDLTLKLPNAIYIMEFK